MTIIESDAYRRAASSGKKQINELPEFLSCHLIWSPVAWWESENNTSPLANGA